MQKEFYTKLQDFTQNLIDDFDKITDTRKKQLRVLADHLSKKRIANEKINLIFICTHNSRRSHLSHILAQTAINYYGLENLGIGTFSGGTEATAFNIRAINALRKVGFEIEVSTNEMPSSNPKYIVKMSESFDKITCFSKKYSNAPNPQDKFCAVMTCSHADKNCPIVIGAQVRISLPYDDPKDFDDTPQETQKYIERTNEIGREFFWVFSKINPLT